MEEELLPLSALYEKAVDFCEHDNVATSSQAEQLQAEDWLQQCERMATTLGLFSPNEEAEDIATGDLKYLLVPFHLAKLKVKTQKQEPLARRQILEDAKHFFARFLRTCDLYSLVPAGANVEEPTDPTTKRQQKIERFRREKAAKARLATAEQTLLARKRRKVLLNGEGESEDDEEAEREAWLTKIELAVLDAAEQIQLLEQEIGLLRHAEKLPEDERRQPQQQPPTDLLQQLRQAAGSLETRREQIRADVLRPSHNLPTRTLREQAEIDLEQARRVDESQRQAKLKQEELEADEDFQVQRQRAWDDWTDDNPRGAGNSRLRPTA